MSAVERNLNMYVIVLVHLATRLFHGKCMCLAVMSMSLEYVSLQLVGNQKRFGVGCAFCWRG